MGLQKPILRFDNADPKPAEGSLRRKTLLKGLAMFFTLLLSAALLYRVLSEYEFSELVALVSRVPLGSLLAALAFTAASYLCLSINDWLALSYARRPLPYRTAALTSFVALGIGHSIGFAALSSGAIRYRFYSRFGLGAEQIAKIVVFCGITILLGMIALGDFALLAMPDSARTILHLSKSATLTFALVLALVPVSYVALAALLRGKLHLHRWSFEMPSPALAIAQVLVGTLNFICVAASLHAAISAVANIPYMQVLSAFVLANAATILTHAPGGLGVIETVVTMILHRPDLIGAVLVFRLVYFLVPLCAGCLLLVLSEAWFHSKDESEPARAATAKRGEERRATQGAPDRGGRGVEFRTSGG